MKYTSSPCKDCKDRKLGCHSVCDKYIEYSKQNEKIYKERRLNQDLISHTFNTSERIRRQEHRFR